MKVLFLESDPMWIYGLPNGFRDAGHQVLVSGPLTKEKLPYLIQEFAPDLIFSMGWGPENSSIEKEMWIKDNVKKSKIPHVYWATEDPTHTQAFTIPFLRVVQPDFVFTICKDRVAYYESLGIQAAHLDFGFHPSVHRPTEPYECYRGKIAVLANAYPNKLKIYPAHYRHQSLNILVRPLLEANIRVDFYGKGWDKMEAFLGRDIPKEWLHDYVPYIEANKIYSSNDIIIGIQNHLTQLNQRIYEILGSAGFLLTNNTPEINRLFKVGQDLVVSNSPEETVQLVQCYLKNSKERKYISEKGAIAVKAYEYKQRAQYIIEVLNKEGVFMGKTSQYKLELMEAQTFIHEQWELYTICNGDTLWAISRKFGVSVDNLKQLNGLDSDWIEAGQLLKIKKITNKEKQKSSLLIQKGVTNKPYIALTYDAGDGAAATLQILDILEKHNIKATFFLTGEWSEKYPDIGKRIVDLGHEIGNHTFSHPDLTQMSKSEIVNEVIKTENAIKRLANADCKPLFRPPFGAWNQEVLEVVGEIGYTYSIYWSIDTIDWKEPDADVIVSRVMENVKSDEIILMHLEYFNTAKATEMMIPKLKDLGYQFVCVSELLKSNNS